MDPSRGNQSQSALRGMQSNSAERNNYAGRSDVAGVGRRLENIPPRHLSRNPFFNRTRQYRREIRVLCLCCGLIVHMRPECSSKPLEIWEQRCEKDILYQILA